MCGKCKKSRSGKSQVIWGLHQGKWGKNGKTPGLVKDIHKL